MLKNSLANTYSSIPKPIVTDTPIREPNKDIVQQHQPNIKTVDKANKIRAAFEGKKWLGTRTLLQYTQYLGKKHAELAATLSTHIKAHTDIKQRVLGAFQDSYASRKSVFAFPMTVGGNHWGLVLVDRKKRSVEYYDSFMNYGEHSMIVKELQHLASVLTEQDSQNTAPYTFACKINKKLQKDAHQCGAWYLYFLEERLKNCDVDFNQLDVEDAQVMIDRYRTQIMTTLIERSNSNP